MTAIAPNDLYAYILVANVLAVVIAARWVKPFGLPGELGVWFVVRLSGRLSPVGGCLEERSCDRGADPQ